MNSSQLSLTFLDLKETETGKKLQKHRCRARTAAERYKKEIEKSAARIFIRNFRCKKRVHSRRDKRESAIDCRILMPT